MPVAAAVLADVLAGDAHPLVLGGSGEHAAEQLPVARLQPGLAAQRVARLGDPPGEAVAHPLQLSQVGDVRDARRPDAGRDRQPREGLRREPQQLPLEAADLAAQLGPREALVASDQQRVPLLSFEQIRHEPWGRV